MKIYFFPKYSSMGPSSRYRLYNYLPYYESAGFKCKVYPLLGDWYLECLWGRKKKKLLRLYILEAYLFRIWKILTLPAGSVVYIGADLFPYLPFSLEKYLVRKSIKYVIEYDDAIFHLYDKNKFFRFLFSTKTPKAIQYARCVITGSEYLTKYALLYNKNVIEIPTSIDWIRYKNSKANIEDRPFTIGWIGSSSQSLQIIKIAHVFRKLKNKISFKLILIGFDKTKEDQLGDFPYEIVTWDNNTEIKEMENFHVGIMPLEETPFNCGKCAFKLVQYMAIGLPTISTPLVSNMNVDKKNGNLFARSSQEWIDSILSIYNNREYFRKVGLKNKQTAEKYFTIQKNSNIYITTFNNL